MQFQVFIKNSKRGEYQIYINQTLVDEVIPNLSHTWCYHPILKNKKIEYANLYCEGKNLDEMCPSHLQYEWKNKSDHLKAFYRSCFEAKIDLGEHSFYDLVPKKVLMDYLEIKNQITQYIFETGERPQNYNFLLEVTKVVEDIKEQKLNIDFSALKERLAEFKVRQFYKKIAKVSPFVSYNIFGTKTGRLTTNRGSFPILTMDKNYRSIIKPRNDFFLELDFNAAEIRTLLALSGEEQPKEDIHEWNAKNVYRDLQTREEAKKRIFAWLYNPASKDYLSSRVYDREGVVQKYYNEGQVKTFCNRVIPADDHHALNYIIQSTASDLFLDRMIAVHKYLSDKKSFISFSIHDSLVIDFAESERDLIFEVAQIFSRTKISDFLTNVAVGKNYGEMKVCKL